MLWKNNILFKVYGFSLPELLTTVLIITIISAVAIPSYIKYKEAPVKAAMKSELSELTKFLNYTHSVDGGYHQKIYSIGYRPNKHLMTDAGFQYTRNVQPCCNVFPSSGANGAYDPYLTLQPNVNTSSNVLSSTRAEHICSAGYCNTTDKVVTTTLTATSFSTGDSDCITAFNSQNFECDCDEFKIYSRAFIRGKNPSGRKAALLANEDGLFCYSDTTNTIELH